MKGYDDTFLTYDCLGFRYRINIVEGKLKGKVAKKGNFKLGGAVTFGIVHSRRRVFFPAEVTLSVSSAATARPTSSVNLAGMASAVGGLVSSHVTNCRGRGAGRYIHDAAGKSGASGTEMSKAGEARAQLE